MSTSHPFDAILRDGERTALFIDGANLYGACRALEFDLDFKRLLDDARERCRLIRANYYTAILQDQEFQPLRQLLDWLDYNGFAVITKNARDYTDAMGRRRVKGDMDVDIAVDLLESAGWLDHAVLFSGDGDFIPAVEALQRRGVRVTAVSTVRSSPPFASDDLRRQADAFLDLMDLSRTLGRPARAPRFQDDA